MGRVGFGAGGEPSVLIMMGRSPSVPTTYPSANFLTANVPKKVGIPKIAVSLSEYVTCPAEWDTDGVRSGAQEKCRGRDDAQGGDSTPSYPRMCGLKLEGNGSLFSLEGGKWCPSIWV